MPPARGRVQAVCMKSEKWAILGALAGLVAIAISRQLRLNRHRRFMPLSDYSKLEARERPSIDDIPTLQDAAEGKVEKLDESVAPAAPL